MPSLEAFDSTRPVKVLVLGGSYSGLSAALNLLDLCNSKPPRFTPDKATETPQIQVQIKIIDKRDGYFHIIGAPLALASKAAADKSWVRFADIPALTAPGISWQQGDIVKIDPETKTATIADTISGETQEEIYDYVVAGTGLNREWPVVPQSLTKSEYLTETGDHIDAVKSAKEGVVVIGGGAVGIEMAAELKLVEPSQKVTLIHSREHLLSSEPLPEEFKTRTLSVLRDAGVEVILNDRVVDVIPHTNEDGSISQRLTLKNGSHLQTGKVIFALSQSVPTSSYLPPSTLDADGYVKVAPALHFSAGTANHKNHFAIGDLAAWSGIKRCGGALDMGFTAAVNVHQLILQEQTSSTPKFNELKEYPPVLALAVGTKAVCYSPDDGVKYGKDQMALMFGDDLGWSVCWNYLRLGSNGSETAKAV